MNCLTVDVLAEQLRAKRPLELIDVREPWEYELAHLEGSKSVPLSTIPAFIGTAEPGRTYVFICHHGIRSARATAFALAQGFEDVFNLTGGVAAWSARIDATFPTY